MMNRLPAGGPNEAVLRYEHTIFKVVKPGTYVLCAVSGKAIPIGQLRYWSVPLQQAYAGPEEVLKKVNGAV
jgi:hypothetical protein